MKIFALLLVLLVCLTGTTTNAPEATAVRPGKDFALFFAVNNYDHDTSTNGWRDLSGPIKDAEEIAADLHRFYSFDTLVVRNPTLETIRLKLDQYRNKQYADDAQLFIFFSGHGKFLDDLGEGFFIPRNGKKTADDPTQATWLSLLRLRRQVNTLPCRHILIAIDACYSGTFDERIAVGKNGGGDDEFDRPINTDAARNKLINDLLASRSRVYCTSGGRERTPDPSRFAAQWKAALRGLGGKDHILKLSELDEEYLQNAIPKPQMGSFEGHEDGGTFLFVYPYADKPSPPLPSDKDGDGIPDIKDKCADVWANTPDGCPETIVDNDGDAVPDAEDRCPEMNGSMANYGCPESGMVLILGGTFELGDLSGGGADDEKPAHKVTLSNFYLSVTEVSVKEYLEFARATSKNLPEWAATGSEYNIRTGSNPYYKQLLPYLEYDDYPVVGISWLDAVEYCNWLSKKEKLQPVYTIKGQDVQADWKANGYRLPTEAEWEFAARTRGKNTPRQTVRDSDSGRKKLLSVTDAEQNELGLYHLGGNVMEWCWDWLDATYYGKSLNSRNPVGPAYGRTKTLRGGSFLNPLPDNRVSKRSGAPPSGKYIDAGFRIAKNAN